MASPAPNPRSLRPVFRGPLLHIITTLIIINFGLSQVLCHVYADNLAEKQCSPNIILILADDLDYIHDLTQKVLTTGFSTLTSKGGITPENTLGKDMRLRPEIFCQGSEPGFYGVRNPEKAAQDYQIRAALYALHSEKIERFTHLLRRLIGSFNMSQDEIDEFKKLQFEISRVSQFYHQDVMPFVSLT
jgi:hypothetical protein